MIFRNGSQRITINLANKPVESVGGSSSDMSAVFSQIRSGNTLLRKVTDEDKNKNKKHFSKNRNRSSMSSFTPKFR